MEDSRRSRLKASSETQGQIVGAKERLSLAPTICHLVSEDGLKAVR